jgi:hypothetical protein
MFSQRISDGVLTGKPFVDARTFDESPIRPTKLFIGGITRNTSTKMLRDHFSCFGRVLDCVAMRQPDGRPRGFGYVTLDSPAAAAQCLSEHQVIDARIVDLKPAVAEGAMGLVSSIGKDILCRSAPNASFDLSSDHSTETFVGKPWWTPTFQKARGDVADCVDLLSGCTSPALNAGPPGTFEDFNFHDNVNVKHAQGTPAGALSANAPEFVPSNHNLSGNLAILETEGSQSESIPELKTGKLTPSSTLDGRSPFTELTNMDMATYKACNRKPFGELTNIQSSFDRIKPLKLGVSGTMNRTGSLFSPQSLIQTHDLAEIGSEIFVLEDEQFATTENVKEIQAEEKVFCKGGSTVFVDAMHSHEVAATTLLAELREGVGAVELPAKFSTMSADEDTDSDGSDIYSGELPSLGSAKHSAGECKRCNFFAKGRCLNGKNCTFCHLPHEKRKPSRQEKRERREAWLLTQGDLTLLDEETPVDMHDRTPHRAISVNSDNHQVHVPPPRVAASQSPSCIPRSPYPLLPPGLAPPLNHFESWQPDAEVSPICVRSLVMSRTMAAAPGALPLGESDASASLLLSTVPSPAPLPVAVPVNANMAATLLKQPNTRTIGTQTELELVCPCCGGNSNAKIKMLPLESKAGQVCQVQDGLQWTRGELLSFREGVERAPRSSAPAFLFQSIPIPTATPEEAHAKPSMLLGWEK